MKGSTQVATDPKRRQRLFKKHAVEKRRRGRINDSLEMMKSIILYATNKNPDDYAQMEKADILEMTVNFLNQKAEKAALLRQKTVVHPVQRRVLSAGRDVVTSSIQSRVPAELQFRVAHPTMSCGASYAQMQKTAPNFTQYGYTPRQFTASIHAHSGLRKPVPIRPAQVWRPW